MDWKLLKEESRRLCEEKKELKVSGLNQGPHISPVWLDHFMGEVDSFDENFHEWMDGGLCLQIALQ